MKSTDDETRGGGEASEVMTISIHCANPFNIGCNIFITMFTVLAPAFGSVSSPLSAVPDPVPGDVMRQLLAPRTTHRRWRC